LVIINISDPGINELSLPTENNFVFIPEIRQYLTSFFSVSIPERCDYPDKEILGFEGIVIYRF